MYIIHFQFVYWCAHQVVSGNVCLACALNADTKCSILFVLSSGSVCVSSSWSLALPCLAPLSFLLLFHHLITLPSSDCLAPPSHSKHTPGQWRTKSTYRNERGHPQTRICVCVWMGGWCLLSTRGAFLGHTGTNRSAIPFAFSRSLSLSLGAFTLSFGVSPLDACMSSCPCQC